MKFCPKCETRMKPKVDEGIILCPKCGFIDEKVVQSDLSSSPSNRPVQENLSSGSLKVMDGEKGPEALPTTATDCPKCSNDTAYWWMLQTRSADEPTTQFYRCTRCSHTWRNYS